MIEEGGVYLVRLLEHANRYSKEKVFDYYKRTCQNDYWDYDSMTRKEMFERMIETYTPEYLVSICTTWELKALRRLLRNQDLEDDRYRFERHALSSKFLYFDKELPEEFKKNVKLAVKILIWIKRQKKMNQALSFLESYEHSALLNHL